MKFLYFLIPLSLFVELLSSSAFSSDLRKQIQIIEQDDKLFVIEGDSEVVTMVYLPGTNELPGRFKFFINDQVKAEVVVLEDLVDVSTVIALIDNKGNFLSQQIKIKDSEIVIKNEISEIAKSEEQFLDFKFSNNGILNATLTRATVSRDSNGDQWELSLYPENGIQIELLEALAGYFSLREPEVEVFSDENSYSWVNKNFFESNLGWFGLGSVLGIGVTYTLNDDKVPTFAGRVFERGMIRMSSGDDLWKIKDPALRNHEVHTLDLHSSHSGWIVNSLIPKDLSRFFLLKNLSISSDQITRFEFYVSAFVKNLETLEVLRLNVGDLHLPGKNRRNLKVTRYPDKPDSHWKKKKTIAAKCVDDLFIALNNLPNLRVVQVYFPRRPVLTPWNQKEIPWPGDWFNQKEVLDQIQQKLKPHILVVPALTSND